MKSKREQRFTNMKEKKRGGKTNNNNNNKSHFSRPRLSDAEDEGSRGASW